MNVYFHRRCSASSHVGKLQKRVLTQQVCLHYHMSNYSWFREPICTSRLLLLYSVPLCLFTGSWQNVSISFKSSIWEWTLQNLRRQRWVLRLSNHTIVSYSMRFTQLRHLVVFECKSNYLTRKERDFFCLTAQLWNGWKNNCLILILCSLFSQVWYPTQSIYSCWQSWPVSTLPNFAQLLGRTESLLSVKLRWMKLPMMFWLSWNSCNLFRKSNRFFIPLLSSSIHLHM